jgi:hypothetical protein
MNEAELHEAMGKIVTDMGDYVTATTRGAGGAGGCQCCLYSCVCPVAG